MTRAGRAAYWIAPCLFCLIVYRLAFRIWFQYDDFAWLGLRLQIHNFGDFWRALFLPQAQGTVRFLSDRLFFVVLTAIFGIDPLPFRICAFLTQFANLILLSSITGRLTGSRTAGFWAAMLWTSSSALAVPMLWASAYNEILFSFFLLAAFHFLLRYIETGKRRYYIAQWAAFLLGFGALELNVVYPALAALYTWCSARKYFRKTLPLVAFSVAYTVTHTLAAPLLPSGPYALHYDWRIFATLWTYGKWALGPGRLRSLGQISQFAGLAGTALLTLGLLGFAFWKVRRKEWLAVFFLGWFGIVILPLLPLRDHITEYYPLVPSLGLAMLGGWGIAEAWKRRLIFRVAALILTAIYLGSMLPVTASTARRYHERGEKVEKLVAGVIEAHRIHPHQTILLTGVSADLFWSSVYGKPFRLFGIEDVYLAPGSESLIPLRPELGDVGSFILPQAPTLRALDQNEAVVYDVRGKRLKNVTATYLSEIAGAGSPPLPMSVDAANPEFSGQFGPGWYDPENGYRWMSQKGTLWIGAPTVSTQKLYIAGYATSAVLTQGPLKLTVILDGLTWSQADISKPDTAFELTFFLPKSLIGKEKVELALEVDHSTTPPGDSRKLGLAFTAFEIK
jgi:hypothetical protein